MFIVTVLTQFCSQLQKCFHMASGSGLTAIVTLLLDYGADVMAMDKVCFDLHQGPSD